MVLAVAWLLVAIVASLFIGAAIRLADRRTPLADCLVVLPDDLTVDDVLGRPRTAPSAH